MQPMHPDMLAAEVDDTRRRLSNEPSPSDSAPPPRALVGALLVCFAAVVVIASLDRDEPDDLPSAVETAPTPYVLSDDP